MDPLVLVTLQCLQEGSKARMLNPCRLPKQTQQKWQVPMMKKNLQIESKLIHVIVKGEKQKGKRSIWSETTTLIVSCWPFIGLPVQDAWGRASAPVRGHPSMANGPCLWHCSNPEVPQQDNAEGQALSVSAPTTTGPLDFPKPSGGSLFSYETSSPRSTASPLPSLLSYTWLPLGFHQIFENCLLG